MAENFFSFKFMDRILQKLEQEVDYEFGELKNLKPITRLRDTRPVREQPANAIPSGMYYKSWIIKKARPHIDKISEALSGLDSCLLSLTYAAILFASSQVHNNQV